MEAPAEILTGPLTSFTRTDSIVFQDVAFTEITVDYGALVLTPDILAVNSNFGHVVREDAQRYLKAPKAPKQAPGRRNMHKQGEGSCFNSCLEVTVAPPARYAAQIPNKRMYSTKLFRTGTVQIPGGLLPELADVLAVAVSLRAWVNANPGLRAVRAGANPAAALGRDYRAPVRVVPLADVAAPPAGGPTIAGAVKKLVIQNFKTALRLPRNHVVEYGQLQAGLQELAAAAPIPIGACHVIMSQTPKLQFEFVLEAGVRPLSVLVNVYQRGKVNVLGLTHASIGWLDRIEAALVAVFRRLWADVIIELPDPDPD